MRVLFVIFVMCVMAGCSSAAANTQAEATLERQRQLTAQAEADGRRQEEMLAMLQQQALANQQAQAAAAQAQAQAQAALAQAGQAQANALNAVANSSGSGVRLPTSVALALLGAIVVIVLGIIYAIRQPAQPRLATYQPPAVRTVARLLPNPSDPQFNRLLADGGGYWRNNRAYASDGTPLALLEVLTEEGQWRQ